METFKERLKQECKELIVKKEKLNSFMQTKEFYDLSRAKKRLMYKQMRIMFEYIEVLGERMELEGIEDFK